MTTFVVLDHRRVIASAPGLRDRSFGGGRCAKVQFLVEAGFRRLIPLPEGIDEGGDAVDRDPRKDLGLRPLVVGNPAWRLVKRREATYDAIRGVAPSLGRRVWRSRDPGLTVLSGAPPMHFQPLRTPWFARPLLALQARRHGRALEPTQLWATRPRLLAPFLLMFRSLHRRSALPATLRWLVAARVSQLCQCAFCVDMNAAQALEASTSRAKLDALAEWRTSDVFGQSERLALDYAEAVTATPVPDLREKVLALREHLGEAAVIELTALVGFQNFSARFNAALGAEAHGFCAVPPGRDRR